MTTQTPVRTIEEHLAEVEEAVDVIQWDARYMSNHQNTRNALLGCLARFIGESR